MHKKQAKNWTRNVIYISIFQVFHPTDVEIKVSKRFLSSIRSRWSVLFVFNWNNISRSIIRDFVDKSWFGYDHGHVTGTCLIFEWPKKKNCKNNICSRSPGDHDCGKLFLQVVVFRKLLAENWLDKLYCTDHGCVLHTCVLLVPFTFWLISEFLSLHLFYIYFLFIVILGT